MTAPLLLCRGVSTYYGKIIALREVDVEVNEGEIVTMIGANGAGKSTLMMTIFGKPRARAGSISFDGRDITEVPTHEIARLRIAQAPEGRRIFLRMSVAENLQMGADATECSEAERASGLERVLTLFPRLKERMTQRGGTLSGGEQQMLAIGRGLMARPSLMLLDEPTLGLAPVVALHMFELIRTLSSSITLLVAEQDVRRTLDVARRAYVIDNGRVALEGDAGELAEDPKIRQAYLGL